MVDAVSSADLQVRFVCAYETSLLTCIRQGYQMRTIVRSVRGWRRIGMGVRRSLIWVPVGRTCFMSGGGSVSPLLDR